MDQSDAAVIGTDYIKCRAGPTSTQQSTNEIQSTLNPSTSISTIPPTSPSQGRTSTSSAVQSKSGARGFAAEVFGAGYIQMIMFIAMVTSLFSAFV